MPVRRIALILAILFVALAGARSRALADDNGPDPGHIHGNGQTHHLPARTDVDTLATPSGQIVPGNLTYHGGPVIGTLTAYTIFWEPSGHTFESGGDGNYKTNIDGFFTNETGTSGSPYYNILSQYSTNPSTSAAIAGGPIANLAKFGGTWTDTTAYPESPLQDKDIQTEVSRALSKNTGWSTTNSAFFVYTPVNVQSCDGTSCAGASYCAYHGYFSSSNKTVLYASLPDPGSNLAACGTTYKPSGDQYADSAINLMSHEEFETVSDPQLNAWYDANGYEIGDKCAWEFGPVNASSGDVTLNKVNYIVQEEWSNSASTCTLSYVSVAGASASTVVASSTSIATSKTGTIAVTLKTSAGAVVPGKTVTLKASSTSATVSPASGVSNASGVVTFTIGDSKAETVTYTATDTTDSLTLMTQPSVKW